MASRSGLILAGYSARSTGKIRQGILSGILGGIHWQAALAGYSAGSTGKIRHGMLSGILGGIHWRAALAGYSAGSTGEPLGGILGGIHLRAALAGYWAGSTGEQLWRDTRRDPPASCPGLGGEPLWRDTRRDPLASCSGGILGGIHWRAALAGFWVGVWCRSIANADSNIKSNNPFLSGGEQQNSPYVLLRCLASNSRVADACFGKHEVWATWIESPQ